MQESPRPEVGIVGGGPTGLTLAAALVDRGLPVTVFDSELAASTQWRASTFHPPTLELLESLSVSEQMVEQGLKAERYQVRDRQSGLIAEFDYSELSDETPYPFRLQLEQYKYSAILLNRLADNPLFTIRWGEPVTAVDQGVDSVEVTAYDGVGFARHRFPLVVGADGASSVVRKSLALEFPGLTYPQRFLILSTDYPFDERFTDIALVNYIWDPVEPVMILRIPDVWRVMFSLGPDDTDTDPRADGSVHRRLTKLIGDDASTVSVLSSQIYSVHQRVAERFHQGRVALIGDAAHINSPVGGLGLNSGIHDALELAPRLERVLGGTSVDTELAGYTERRRRVALEVVRKVTHRNTEQMTETDDAARRRNHAALAEIAADPSRRREWLLESSMIASVRAQDAAGG